MSQFPNHLSPRSRRNTPNPRAEEPPPNLRLRRTVQCMELDVNVVEPLPDNSDPQLPPVRANRTRSFEIELYRPRRYPQELAREELAEDAVTGRIMYVRTAPGEPNKHTYFCSVCGFIGAYKCMRCAAVYCNTRCYRIHRQGRCYKMVDEEIFKKYGLI